MGSRVKESIDVVASPAVSRALAALGGKDPRWWHDGSARFRSRTSRSSKRGPQGQLCVVRLEELTDDFLCGVAQRGRGKKRYLVFIGDLPVEAVAERIVGLNVRDPSRIHLCRASTPKQERQLIERLVNAIELGASNDAIIDAWWEPAAFVVLSPRFERLHIPRERLLAAAPDLRRLSPKRLQQFAIHEDGAYVHWPKADVHLGWDQLHQMVDARARLAAVRARGAFRARQGAAIRSLRDAFGLTQSEVEGLTARHLRRIEAGTQALTYRALRALAAAHDMTPDEYLAAMAERM